MRKLLPREIWIHSRRPTHSAHQRCPFSKPSSSSLSSSSKPPNTARARPRISSPRFRSTKTRSCPSLHLCPRTCARAARSRTARPLSVTRVNAPSRILAANKSPPQMAGPGRYAASRTKTEASGVRGQSRARHRGRGRRGIRGLARVLSHARSPDSGPESSPSRAKFGAGTTTGVHVLVPSTVATTKSFPGSLDPIISRREHPSSHRERHRGALSGNPLRPAAGGQRRQNTRTRPAGLQHTLALAGVLPGPSSRARGPLRSLRCPTKRAPTHLSQLAPDRRRSDLTV